MNKKEKEGMNMGATLDYLKKRQQFIRMFYVFLLLLMILAFLSLWISGYLTALLVVGELALHFFFLRPRVKDYAKACNKANIEATVVRSLDGGTLQEKESFSVEAIDAASLVPVEADKAGAVWSSWMVTGCRDRIGVQLADVSIRYAYSNGRGRLRSFATGCWISLDLPVDTGCKLWAVSRTAYDRDARMQYYNGKPELEQFLCGDENTDALFALYREAGSEAEPDKRYLRRLMDFQQYTPGGPLAVALMGDKMHVYIAGRFLARRVTLAQEPNAENLQFDPLPELAEALSLAKTACNCCTASASKGEGPLRQAAMV